jgi:hypothetical protein
MKMYHITLLCSRNVQVVKEFCSSDRKNFNCGIFFNSIIKSSFSRKKNRLCDDDEFTLYIFFPPTYPKEFTFRALNLSP